MRLAEALSIHSVLVPPAPGNLSAMGLLCADVRHDLACTMLHRLTPDFLPRVRAVYDELLVEAPQTSHPELRAMIQDGRIPIPPDRNYPGAGRDLALKFLGHAERLGVIQLAADRAGRR